MDHAALMSLSVQQLDTFDLCKDWPATRALLLAADPDPVRRFTITEAMAAGCILDEVRPLLFLAARVAQHDLAVRARLTGFLNDCVIRSLSDFEASWPDDDRPRRMVEATRPLVAGGVSGSEWLACVDEGLRAWAAVGAEGGFDFDGAWALVGSCNWRDVKPDALHGWLDWARWAVPVLDMHLRTEECGTGSWKNSPWTVARLRVWLAPEAPEPLSLPDKPEPAPNAKTGPAHIERSGSCELYWHGIAVWPDGLRVIEGLRWDADDATLPDGVEVIEHLTIADGRSVVLPLGVRHIKKIVLCFGARLTLPAGVRTLGEVYLWEGALLEIPASLHSIDLIDLDDVDLELPLTVRHVGELRFYDSGDPEDAEQNALIRGEQCFTKSQKDLHFGR